MTCHESWLLKSTTSNRTIYCWRIYDKTKWLVVDEFFIGNGAQY